MNLVVVDEGEAAAEVDRIERDGEVGPPRQRLLGVAHVRIGPEVLHALGGAQRGVAVLEAHRRRRDAGQPVGVQRAGRDLVRGSGSGQGSC